MRNKGIGGKLFDKVILYGKKIGAQRISWNVIDWNESAIKFYEGKGAEIVEGWSIVHLSNDCLLYTSPSPRDVEECRMP